MDVLEAAELVIPSRKDKPFGMSITTIERVREAEATLLARMSQKTFVDTYVEINPENKHLLTAYVEEVLSHANIALHLSDKDIEFYFLKLESVPVGYVKLISHSSKVLELEKLYLIEGHKGQGLGQELFNFVKARAQQQGFKAIKLSVYEQNLEAIKFYQRNGFKTLGKSEFNFAWQGQVYKDLNLEMLLELL